MELLQEQVVGEELTAIFMVDGTPRHAVGTVVCSEPFAFETASKWAKELDCGTKALFVFRIDDELHKASTRVTGVRDLGGSWIVDTQNIVWETVERRRSSRSGVSIPVTYRSVSESEGGARMESVEAATVDLSTGGACLSCPKPPPVGSLVDITLPLESGSAARALGVVTWSREAVGEFGIEFLDCMGDTKSAITSFLSRAA